MDDWSCSTVLDEERLVTETRLGRSVNLSEIYPSTRSFSRRIRYRTLTDLVAINRTRYYDHNKPMGSRFSASVANSTVDRMYHSAATLLPDGSIFSSGSNPNADFIAPGTPGYKYPTEYRVERFYPDYYTLPRPVPTGVPTTIGYGGAYFNLTLPARSVGPISNLDNTKVTIIRPGFSTHAMNMGQRYVQLSVSDLASRTVVFSCD